MTWPIKFHRQNVRSCFDFDFHVILLYCFERNAIFSKVLFLQKQSMGCWEQKECKSYIGIHGS